MEVVIAFAQRNESGDDVIAGAASIVIRVVAEVMRNRIGPPFSRSGAYGATSFRITGLKLIILESEI